MNLYVTPWHLNQTGAAICAGALMLAWAVPASAQVASYQVFDLGTLPSASPAESQALAINDKHEVVGWSRDSVGQMHAVLWLYCPNYGLAHFTLHDLTDLAGYTLNGEATDINSAGLVVGGQTTASTSLMSAFIWDLTSLPSLATVELNPLSGNIGDSIAYGVSEVYPAIVVGTSPSDAGACRETVFQNHGFWYEQNTSPSAVNDVGAGSGTYGEIRAVNSAFVPEAVGYWTSICGVTDCVPENVAADWAFGGSPALAAIPDNGPAYGAAALGLNESGHIVGIALTATSECIEHASFWSSSAATLVDLGAIGISGDESIAYKVTNAGPSGELTAVGSNLTLLNAWRWDRDSGGSWSGTNLNSKISPSCGWELYVAFDVSDDGWIVGYGLVGGELHGFLLKPIDCADLNGDCVVDGGDLGFLLGAWSCAALPCWRADLNVDGAVDGADLGILLGSWGACPCICSPPSSPLVDGGGENSYQVKLLQGLEILGFDSVASYQSWAATASDEEIEGVLSWLMAYLIASE